jgi:hypothetical protein
VSLLFKESWKKYKKNLFEVKIDKNNLEFYVINEINKIKIKT